MELFDDSFFTQEKPPHLIPLAERVRATSLERYFGQSHIVGKDGLVTKMIDNETMVSIIFWGPPGTGKTTLAKIIAKKSDSHFYSINAVSSSVKELRTIINSSKDLTANGKRVILFIDEIHRFNKAQQDALLNAVENGTITLIGATTENPSFEVNSALLSRSKVLVLKSLSNEDLKNILENAIKNDTILSKLGIKFDKDVEEILISTSSGDARKLLNTLEICVKMAEKNGVVFIDKQIIAQAIQTSARYDKKGEAHYDTISAFIKSIRGSDPDAAIYYLARMLHAGEDVKFIARRLIILASEDIGNASPNGLVLANSCFDAVHKIGMPEARIILAQCTTYLASQPKSNASYEAINRAMSIVEKTGDLDIPLHLRNAPTKLMKDLNYGKDYKYAHSYRDNFIQDSFLPKEIEKEIFYKPSENGQEKRIKERLELLWKGKKRYDK
ncbi:MAG: AAA family ATPase [Candidatus Cloacimonadota bacterium]|nr:MAG: AAA family ATPase [Candidatus Cloacimonadota bacterium]PIE77541.1 MAG: AAA family ATPase [Candidatus Delongbacteria bacterium]